MRGPVEHHAHSTLFPARSLSSPSRPAPVRPPRRAAPKPVTLLNVSYDPTRELYEDFNKQFATLLEGEDRPGRHDPAVARRLGQAGPLGDRRPRGRRGDARAGLRHRPDRGEGAACCRPTGRTGCPTTARPTRRRSCCSCARGTRRGIKDWDDLVKPGVSVITPNPKTSGGARWNYLAAWAWALRQPGGNEAKREGVRRQAVQERAGARRRRPRVHDHLRGAGHRRRADRVGERGAAGDQGAGPGQVRGRGAVGQHPGRAAGGGGGQGGGQARHQGRGPGLSRVPVHRRQGRRSRRSTTTARGSGAVAAKYASQFPKVQPVHRGRGVRRLEEGARDALRRRRRCSIRSTSRGASPGCRSTPTKG